MSTNGTDPNRIVLASDWRPTDATSAAQREAQRVALVEHVQSLTSALNQHAQAILSLRSKLVEVDTRLVTTEALLQATQGAVDELERDAARWGVMMFWQRLRWLLRGA